MRSCGAGEWDLNLAQSGDISRTTSLLSSTFLRCQDLNFPVTSRKSVLFSLFAKSLKIVDKVFILNQNKPDNPNTFMRQIDKLRDIEDQPTADCLTPEILKKLKQLELEYLEAQ